jgi:predicted enzyme related to lactoylglutathione lyase
MSESNNTKKGRVTGIGGIFFTAQNPAELRAWYKQNLGMPVTDYGCNFEWREHDQPEKVGSTVWSPFKEGTSYFQPSTREFMINFRVEHLDELLAELEAAGVKLLKPVESFEYGRFAHIMDPEGNKLELWEAADESTSGEA